MSAPSTGSSQPPHRRAAGPVFGFRHSAVWLSVALGCLFVSTPFVEEWRHGSMLEACLLTCVMVFAVLAVGARGRTLVIALLLVLPALAARWIHYLRPDLLSSVVYLSSGMVFIAFVVTQILRFVLHTPRADANALCAGLSGYLLLGLLWVPAYMLVSDLNPKAFVLGAGSVTGDSLDGFQAFYFSFITLTTVGYGDILPVSKVARMPAIVEAITGLLYVGVFISRLVGIYSSAQPAAAADVADQA